MLYHLAKFDVHNFDNDNSTSAFTTCKHLAEVLKSLKMNLN